MIKVESSARRKHKVFLVAIKYIPYLIMLLDVIHTFACIFDKDMPVLSYIGGTSYLVLLFMLLTSFAFNFCSYHRVPIYYIIFNNSLVLYDYYVGIPISDARILDLNLVLIGTTIIIMALLYYKEKKYGRSNEVIESRTPEDS